MASSSRPIQAGRSHNPGTSPATKALGGLGEEAKLDYFREDPDFNSHHDQWHRVYPTDAFPPKDRQGELFWYMHEQMLARYDTERLALKLPRVEALSDYDADIIEGYRVDALITNPDGSANIADRFTGRDANLNLSNVSVDLQSGEFSIAELQAIRDEVEAAIDAGQFVDDGGAPIPLTSNSQGANLLGATLESNDSGITPGRYRDLHGWGHMLLAALSQNALGVMRSTTTAVRDPIFYRWHRHIDDIFFSWQDKLPANDFETGAPPVILRKGDEGESIDIGIALLNDLSAGETNATHFDGVAFAAEKFGGDNWDRPLSEFEGVDGLTRTLSTSIGRYDLTLANGNTFPIFHLDHAEFAYFFRLENTSDTQQRVTVRVFLAASEWAEDRRNWIEMDKFLHVLNPHEKEVVYRPARLSSVVRKPARRPQDPHSTATSANDDYCNCGWPFHLLLPRGSEVDRGMPFRLFVMLTDAESDLAGVERKCGSVSFCGSRDAKYPDSKMMGYPFDRKFSGFSIEETGAKPEFTHVGVLNIAIQHNPTA